jgi:hypothetical protein
VAQLTVAIVLHGLLGVALALLVWGVGLGLRALLRRDVIEAVDAYALGLLAVTVAATGVLLTPWAWLGAAPLLAALLLVAALSPGARPCALPAAARTLGLGLMPLLAFGVALGVLFHGPTEELDSRAFGDMLFYVNKVVSAGRSVVPFDDLLAEGQQIIYAEAAPSFIGAAASVFPGVDPILLQAATFPAFLLSALLVGLPLAGIAPRATGLTVGILAVSAVPYPSWLTESPPVAVALPLTLSLYRLWASPGSDLRLVAVSAIVALGLFATKVVAGLALAIIVLTELIRRARAGGRAAVLLGAVLAIGGTVVALLFATASWYADLFELDFGPRDAIEGLRSQLDTRSTSRLAPAMTLAGQALLLVALLRARLFVLAGVLAFGSAGTWLIAGQALDMVVGVGVLLAALAFADVPARLVSAGAWAPAAAVVLLLSAWLREVPGIRPGLVFVALFAAALLPAFVRGPRLTLGVTAAVASAVAAVGVSGFDGEVTLSDEPAQLTTDDYDIWRRVNDLVPADGLVFTSETGSEVLARQGWNNYPAIAGRQLYIAGWYDGRLVSRPEERARRLALNRAVLTGRRRPGDVGADSRYESYFAVVRNGERVPAAFRPLHRNDRFTLYRIP